MAERNRPGLALTLALAGSVSLGLMAPVAVAGDDLHDKKQRIDARVDDAHDEILAYNKRVAHATHRVIDARRQLPRAEANLRRALAERERTQAADVLAAQELEDATSAVIDAERRLAALVTRFNELRTDLGRFARSAYQMGPFAELEMVLEAKDPAEFTDRLAAIRSVAASNNAALSEMSANHADLSYTELRLSALRDLAEEKKATAAARVAEAAEAAEGAAAAKAIVDGLIAQEEAALGAARRHRSDVRAQYDRLAREQDRIRREIAEAARRLEDSTGVDTDDNASSGQWYFPLPGYSIGSDAGWRYHPILHYTRCHAGADIGAPSGVPIHAVADGVVIQAGWNGGYGNFTTIAHGGGLTSSYGHQLSISVSVGEQVRRGEVIGRVGSTGMSTGPHLHFEARINGWPYSPRGWFGQGAKVRVCV